jgi:hypothetical protein
MTAFCSTYSAAGITEEHAGTFAHWAFPIISIVGKFSRILALERM